MAQPGQLSPTQPQQPVTVIVVAAPTLPQQPTIAPQQQFATGLSYWSDSTPLHSNVYGPSSTPHLAPYQTAFPFPSLQGVAHHHILPPGHQVVHHEFAPPPLAPPPLVLQQQSLLGALPLNPHHPQPAHTHSDGQDPQTIVQRHTPHQDPRTTIHQPSAATLQFPPPHPGPASPSELVMPQVKPPPPPCGQHEGDVNPDDYDPRTAKMYVVNGLDKAVTENDLHAIFDSYGVERIHVVAEGRTGRSRGFAYIDFTTAEGAQRAVQDRSGSLLMNRPMKIHVSDREKRR